MGNRGLHLRSTSLLVALVLAPEPVRAAELDQISVNGSVSFELEAQLQDRGNGDPNASFDADLFDLVFNFRPVERVRAAADITWEHGAASEDGRGNVALEYGFVEYTVADSLRVRVGKMFIPFGVFNEIHTAKPAFLSVKEAASTNKPERIVDSGRFFPRWGVGVAAFGDLHVGTTDLDYSLMASNGEQERTNPYEEDDNRSKAVTFRLRARLGDLAVGTSGHYDRVTEDADRHLYSHGVELRWQLAELECLAEAVVGRMTPDEGPATTQLGWFVQPAYRFDTLTPYVRFEWVDPSLDASGDQGWLLLGGLNYQVARGLHLKLEYDHFQGADDSTLSALPGNGYDEIKAAVVLGF